MIIHLFHSAAVSGPERLVLPAIASLPAGSVKAHFLIETRLGAASWQSYHFAQSLGLVCSYTTVAGRLDRSAIAELRSSILTERPQILHCHDVKSSLYGLLACRRVEDRPLLCSTHHGVQGRPDRTSRLYEQLYRFGIIRGFDHIYAVSESDFDRLRNSYLPSEKVFLHRNGAGTTFLSDQQRQQHRQKIRDSWRIDNSEFLFGYVGRLSAEKDPLRLIKALAILKEKATELPPWRCIFFGEGPLRPQAEWLVKRYRLDDRVSFPGYRAEIASQMAGLDLLVNTSKAEGLPISMLEAGAAGTAILAPKVGGIPELISGGSLGFLFDAEESDRGLAEILCDLLNDRALCEQTGAKLRQRVSDHFSQQAWLERLLELYGRLCGIERNNTTQLY